MPQRFQLAIDASLFSAALGAMCVVPITDDALAPAALAKPNLTHSALTAEAPAPTQSQAGAGSYRCFVETMDGQTREVDVRADSDRASNTAVVQQFGSEPRGIASVSCSSP